MNVQIEFLQYDNKVHAKEDEWSVVCCSRSEDNKGNVVYHRMVSFIDGKFASIGSMNGDRIQGELMYELLRFLQNQGLKNIRIKEQAFPKKQKYDDISKEYKQNGESYEYAGSVDFV